MGRKGRGVSENTQQDTPPQPDAVDGTDSNAESEEHLILDSLHSAQAAAKDRLPAVMASKLGSITTSLQERLSGTSQLEDGVRQMLLLKASELRSAVYYVVKCQAIQAVLLEQVCKILVDLVYLISSQTAEQKRQSDVLRQHEIQIMDLKRDMEEQSWYAHAGTAVATARRSLAKAMGYQSGEDLMDCLSKERKANKKAKAKSEEEKSPALEYVHAVLLKNGLQHEVWEWLHLICRKCYSPVHMAEDVDELIKLMAMAPAPKEVAHMVPSLVTLMMLGDDNEILV